MKAKQALIDIGVVLALPALFFVGSYFWNPSDDTQLLSLLAPPETDQGVGSKAKAALRDLRAIKPQLKEDATFFYSRAFESLEEFHVDIEPTTLGRTYPFTTPAAVRAAAAAKSR